LERANFRRSNYDAALVSNRRNGYRNVNAAAVLANADRLKSIHVLTLPDAPQNVAFLVGTVGGKQHQHWLADHL
jgi:hypothetical protein